MKGEKTFQSSALSLTFDGDTAEEVGKETTIGSANSTEKQGKGSCEEVIDLKEGKDPGTFPPSAAPPRCSSLSLSPTRNYVPLTLDSAAPSCTRTSLLFALTPSPAMPSTTPSQAVSTSTLTGTQSLCLFADSERTLSPNVADSNASSCAQPSPVVIDLVKDTHESEDDKRYSKRRSSGIGNVEYTGQTRKKIRNQTKSLHSTNVTGPIDAFLRRK